MHLSKSLIASLGVHAGILAWLLARPADNRPISQPPALVELELLAPARPAKEPVPAIAAARARKPDSRATKRRRRRQELVRRPNHPNRASDQPRADQADSADTDIQGARDPAPLAESGEPKTQLPSPRQLAQFIERQT